MKLLDLKDEDIEEHLEKRLSFTGKGIDIYSRYLAYDYCYNCFRDIHEDFLERKERKLTFNEKETLCLQLGLFLGTWGMFRNSNLQKCSYKIYEPLIERIFEEEKLWNIDVKDYCDVKNYCNVKNCKRKDYCDVNKYCKKKDTLKSETCAAIKKFKEDMNCLFDELKLPEENEISVTDALATKIMMVVFGCVPAYDRNFSATVVPMSLNKESLKYIYGFYDKKKGVLDPIQKELKTVDVNGDLTGYTYTMAKIIDIIGFHVTEEADIEEMKKPGEDGKSKWDEKEEKKQKKKEKREKLLKDSEKRLKDC